MLIPRYCTRAIVLGVIFLGLWHSIDLRPEFTPADFPTLGANSSSSIRVLDIRPAREIWWIDADLRTVQLADNPAFEALSYEWGDERKSRSISIGGKRFRVTANLWKALHNVRHADETRTLWVDTICIDQSNNQEKSSQVPLMALIYRRARSVLLSLGKHVPPNWVRDSDASTWTSAFIRKNAEKYWERTGYWLTELMLEEYWKRCWIVQEIGFGHSIQVYADRKPIPWDSFVELATMFASKHHGSLLPNRVLRFQSLRDALYKDGQTYVLKELLETFKDSFCSINLDKILAFAGMAVDCWGECLPVNYAGGVKPRNEAFIVFQNSIADRNSEAPIEMVHNTGLVRRLLSRRQSRIVKVYKLGWLYQPGKWLSTLWRCYYRNSCAAIPETSLLLLVLEYMRAAYLAGKSLRVTTSVWIADTAETKETWAPSPGEHILTGIKTLGAIYAPSMEHKAVKVVSCGRGTEAGSGPQRKTLGAPRTRSRYRLLNVVNLPPSPSQAVDTANGPRLFLGGDGIIMGLVPSNTRVGDKLCQFWNTSSVAVLRRRQGSSSGHDDGYEIVGRAAMVQHSKEIDWDVPVDKNMFLPGYDSSAVVPVELSLDLVMLNYLSFDVVNLPGSVD
ncbi:Heterokaryon incompatibility protein (HET) domain containing protein [Naviculisporaceae sp. PSN 640]